MTMYYEITETVTYTSQGWPRTSFIVTITDGSKVVMTFHTGNPDEARSIGPDLIHFLGFEVADDQTEA